MYIPIISLLITFFVVIFCLISSPLCASPASYALARQRISDHRTDIHIYNVKTRLIVWRSQLTSVEGVSWTPDHRAVTIVDGLDIESYPWRIFIWEAGQKVRVFTSLRVPSKQLLGLTTGIRRDRGELLSFDSSLQQATLSPDKKHLLLRVAEHANGMNWGELWCFTFASGCFQQLYPTISEADWQGSQQVKLTEVHFTDRPSQYNSSIMDSIITYPQAIITVK